jgi:anti-sigma regulatory factor (Ser/Thr protein kinase)
MSEEGARRARHLLDGATHSITEAREHARSFFAQSVPPLDPTLLRDALVAVSELVTNAVRHAPGPCELGLGDDGRRVTIAVSDTHATPPRPRPADLNGGGGLGWHVLCAMAGTVSVQPRPEGKTVAVELERRLVS